MRVLHIISSSGFYGAENVVLSLSKTLKEDGHNPYILCLKGASKPAPEIYLRALREGLFSKLVSCRHRLDIKAISEIKRFINLENVDIIHSHNYKSNFYGLIAAKLTRVPIISTIHLWTGETRMLRFYEYLDKKWFVKRMDHLVVVSPTFYKELKASKIDAERVTFIPNGIDTEIFNPSKVNGDIRKEFRIEDTLVIGNVARLHQEKGHTYLIKAFEKIQSRIPQAKLLIVGEGPLFNSLKSQVRSRKLEDKVVFTGRREDLAALYKAMDILVISSLKEGMPMALLEAMAMELPVVATNDGGIPYVIAQDENGVLVPSADVEALAERVLLLLQNRPLRVKMGKKARNKIVEEFSLQPLYQSYKQVYERIINGN